MEVVISDEFVEELVSIVDVVCEVVVEVFEDDNVEDELESRKLGVRSVSKSAPPTRKVMMPTKVLRFVNQKKNAFLSFDSFFLAKVRRPFSSTSGRNNTKMPKIINASPIVNSIINVMSINNLLVKVTHCTKLDDLRQK